MHTVLSRAKYPVAVVIVLVVEVALIILMKTG